MRPMPKANYEKAYQTKVKRLVNAWDRLVIVSDWKTRPMPSDGPWRQLGRGFGIGARFLKWAVTNGYLERRYDNKNDTITGWLTDWYRLTK